jgi:hypothetical protein
MKCNICGEETNGSIGGKYICPSCDCGITPKFQLPCHGFFPFSGCRTDDIKEN